jgi:DNA-binding IclR family transcriptional regulator
MAIPRAYEIAAHARDEMETLAETAGCQCGIMAVHGRQNNVIAVAGVPASTGRTYIGQRGPLLPPFGLTFIAWASEEEIEEWLNGEPLADEEKDRYRQVLADVRERGFAVRTHDDERERLEEAAVALMHETLSPQVRETLARVTAELARQRTVLLDIEPDRRYRVRVISAPIFDADGRVRVTLTLAGIPEAPGSVVRDHAYALTAAAGRISKRLRALARDQVAA